MPNTHTAQREREENVCQGFLSASSFNSIKQDYKYSHLSQNGEDPFF